MAQQYHKMDFEELLYYCQQQLANRAAQGTCYALHLSLLDDGIFWDGVPQCITHAEVAGTLIVKLLRWLCMGIHSTTCDMD